MDAKVRSRFCLFLSLSPAPTGRSTTRIMHMLPKLKFLEIVSLVLVKLTCTRTQPQRPFRAGTVVSGNENILPTKQSIHQRHKSTSNLKAMTATGALNAPPKRTAFGDV